MPVLIDAGRANKAAQQMTELEQIGVAPFAGDFVVVIANAAQVLPIAEMIKVGTFTLFEQLLELELLRFAGGGTFLTAVAIGHRDTNFDVEQKRVWKT